MLFSPFTAMHFILCIRLHLSSCIPFRQHPSHSALPGNSAAFPLAKVPHSCYTVAENEIHIPQEVQYDNDPRIIRHS